MHEICPVNLIPNGILQRIANRLQYATACNLAAICYYMIILSLYRIFESNMAIYVSCNAKPRDYLRLARRNITSALFAEMPVELKGNSTFFDNVGGGITIVERRVGIYDKVKFESNCSPYDGGALNLEDESYVSDNYITFFALQLDATCKLIRSSRHHMYSYLATYM